MTTYNPITWNYRVVKRSRSENETIFSIHEAYYDSEGNVLSISEVAVEPRGETLEELMRDIKYYQQALTQSVLDYEHFSQRDGDFWVDEECRPDDDHVEYNDEPVVECDTPGCLMPGPHFSYECFTDETSDEDCDEEPLDETFGDD